MGYWAVAQLVPNRTSLALHTLAQQNFTVYAPKFASCVSSGGTRPMSFQRCFRLRLRADQASMARGTLVPGRSPPGMDGIQPAKVSDDVIREIRDRERNGVVELPRRVLKHGYSVRILAGPFRGHWRSMPAWLRRAGRVAAGDARPPPTCYALTIGRRSAGILTW